MTTDARFGQQGLHVTREINLLWTSANTGGQRGQDSEQEYCVAMHETIRQWQISGSLAQVCRPNNQDIPSDYKKQRARP